MSRYVDYPLVDMDEPEPAPEPRQLRPRYLDAEADKPPERRSFAFPHVPVTRPGLVFQPSSSGNMSGRAADPPPASAPTIPGPLASAWIDPDGILRQLNDPTPLRRAFADWWNDNFTPAVQRAADAFTQVHDQLVQAGAVPDQGPTDPKARALWLRRNRNTGPDRDVTRQRRPRHHQQGRGR